MLKFLFGNRADAPQAAAETTRMALTRMQADLNAVLESLPEKPKVTFDPVSGAITLDLPEQLPDEALALPAPDPEDVSSEETISEDTKEAA